MTEVEHPTGAGRGRWGFLLSWVLRILLALAFGYAAYLKLSGQPRMVEEFGKIGLGQGFRYVTGVIEAASVALLLWPRTALLGALGLCGISAGALVAQMGPLKGDLVHVFVLGGLAALAAWILRGGVPGRA